MFNDENGDPIEISGVYSSKSCYGWDFAKPHITFYRVSQLNQYQVHLHNQPIG